MSGTIGHKRRRHRGTKGCKRTSPRGLYDPKGPLVAGGPFLHGHDGPTSTATRAAVEQRVLVHTALHT